MRLEEAVKLEEDTIVKNGNFKYKIVSHYGFCEYLAIVQKSEGEIKESLEISRKNSTSEYFDKENALRRIKKEKRRVCVIDLVKDEWKIDCSNVENIESNL